MKERLNLTIDGALLEANKAYAAKRQLSVSELVEGYFKKVTRPAGQKSILEIIDQLPKPAIDPNADFAGLFTRRISES